MFELQRFLLEEFVLDAWAGAGVRAVTAVGTRDMSPGGGVCVSSPPWSWGTCPAEFVCQERGDGCSETAG